MAFQRYLTCFVGHESERVMTLRFFYNRTQVKPYHLAGKLRHGPCVRRRNKRSRSRGLLEMNIVCCIKMRVPRNFHATLTQPSRNPHALVARSLRARCALVAPSSLRTRCDLVVVHSSSCARHALVVEHSLRARRRALVNTALVVIGLGELVARWRGLVLGLESLSLIHI